MANFSFVVNSQFNPLTYEEMVKPLQEQTALLNSYREAAGQLNAEANAIASQLDETRDSKSYTMYKNYIDNIKSVADRMSESGLKNVSIKDLINLKNAYASDITGIAKGIEARNAAIKGQMDLYTKDPTERFSTDAILSSVDDYLGGKNLDYKHYSLNDIKKSASEKAAQVSKAIRNVDITDESGLKMIAQTSGIPIDELLNLFKMSRKPDGSLDVSDFTKNIAYQIMQQSVKGTGIDTWGNEDIKKEAYRAAEEGLWDALGNIQYTQPRKGSGDGSGSNESYGLDNLNFIGYSNLDIDKDIEDWKDIHDNLINNKDLDLNANINSLKKELNFKGDTFVGDPIYGYIPTYGIKEDLTEEEDKERQKQIRLNNAIEKIKSINPNIKTVGEALRYMNDAVKNQTLFSLNMADYSVVNKRILGNILMASRNNSLPGNIYKTEGFKLGEPVKEINFNNKEHISDIRYDINRPDYLLITISDENGKLEEYAVNPSFVIGDNAVLKDAINNFKEQYAKLNDPEKRRKAALLHSKNVLTNVYAGINNMNLAQSKSSSKVQ